MSTVMSSAIHANQASSPPNRNRLAVLSSWIYSYVFFRRGSRLITRAVPPEES